MTAPPAAWRVPPTWVLLVAVALIACAEAGGASMVQFKLTLTRWARDAMLARPAVHNLVGVRDVDEQILDEALTRLDGGLRLFHLHAEGMGTVIIVTTLVATTLVASTRLRHVVVALVTVGGAVYPFGYLLWSALIPFVGVGPAKKVAEWLVWIPFGGAALVATWLLTLALALRVVRRPRAPGLAAGIALAALAVAAAPAAAHHVGAWTPKDNEVSANFKQLKFSMQAKRFDVALRLYEQGALRQELVRRAAALPPGLDDSVRAGLRAGDAGEAERAGVLLFAVLIRDLAREAERQVGDAQTAPAARLAAGQKFLEAIWRYYNLVDFAVTQRDPKAAASVRLAFDDAEGSGKGADPYKMLEPLRRIAGILSGVIEEFATPTRRES